MSMRAPLTMLLALALGVACAGLVACGAKDNPHLLSAARADRLSKQLDDLQTAVDNHVCDEATQAAQKLSDEITSLPTDTDPALRRRLEEGAQNLTARAEEECAQTDTTETQTTTAPPTETETQTQETTTQETQTTTQETQTQTTTTPPTETTPPPTSTEPDSGGSTVPPP